MDFGVKLHTLIFGVHAESGRGQKIFLAFSDYGFGLYQYVYYLFVTELVVEPERTPAHVKRDSLHRVGQDLLSQSSAIHSLDEGSWMQVRGLQSPLNEVFQSVCRDAPEFGYALAQTDLVRLERGARRGSGTVRDRGDLPERVQGGPQ